MPTARSSPTSAARSATATRSSICGRSDLKREGQLRGDSRRDDGDVELRLRAAAAADGIELLRAQVGDKYVLELMLANDAVIGGEQSGHIID